MSMFFSIIIPVYNAQETLDECLAAVTRSSFTNYEILVVDDGSIDNSVKIARTFPCRIIEQKNSKGAASARNLGVSNARGDIVVFIDSDIVIKEDSLGKIASIFSENKEVSGVSGVYSLSNRFSNFFSQYKHLVLYYRENICGNIQEDSFKAAFIAFRKDIFNEYSFDEKFKNASIEDIEFGRSLISAGHNLILDKTNEVEHIKKFTLKSFSRNQYYRSKSIMKSYIQKSARSFYLQKKRENTYMKRYILRVPLAGLVLIAGYFLLITQSLVWAGAIGSLVLISILLEADFLYFCFKTKGLFFTMQCVAGYFFDGLISCAGAIKGLLECYSDHAKGSTGGA